MLSGRSSRSGMSTLHLSPEILDSPELQLLHRTLAAAELARDFPDAFLFHEAHVNHPELRLRKPFHHLEQHGAAFDFLRRGPVGLAKSICRIPRFASAPLPVVGDGPRGD